jgi:predicted permease
MQEAANALWTDVAVSLRNLRRRAGYGLTLVVTLGLGIAVITALFAIVDALLLRPLPYREADTLLTAGTRLEDGSTIAIVPVRQFVGWRESADFMDAVEAYDPMSLVRTDGAAPEYVTALGVTAGLDELLGVAPWMGRPFGAADAKPGAPDVVLVTWSYWRRMGSPPDILGRDLRLAGRPFTVVGVLPAAFKFPVYGKQDVWIPIQEDWRAAGQAIRQVSVAARARAGLDLEAVQARADRLGAALQAETPLRLGWTLAFSPVTSWRSNPAMRRSLGLLSGATAILLLLALVNAANLTLVRSWARSHEMGIRRALGGTRAQLYRLVFAESAILGLAAALLAVGGARLLVLLLRSVLPSEVLLASVYAFDVGPRVLGFAFVLTLVAGMVLGLVAGATAMRAAPLVERDATPGRLRARKVLMVAEVTLSVVLIAGATVFGRGLLHLLATDLGYDPDRVARVTVSLPVSRYSDEGSRTAFADAAVARLRQVPEVEAVSLGDLPPNIGFFFSVNVAAEGGAPLAEQPTLFPVAEGDERYLEVLGIRLVAGRGLEPSDADAAEAGIRNVLVDQELARLLWDGADPIGRRFRLQEGADEPYYTVVGVVRGVKFLGPDDRMGRHGLIQVRPKSLPRFSLSVLVRTAGPPAPVLPSIARAIRGLDPELPIRDLETGRQAMGEVLETPRLMVVVLGTLAGVAASLVAIGLFGVLAYAVSRRTRELGIRIALGASTLEVRRRLVREGLVLGATGAALGIALSVWLSRYARSLLFEVSPVDPVALAGVASVALLLAGLAALVPAMRASRIDPVRVLRAD